MAIIEKRIRLAGSKGESEVKAMFDSGSTYSCIQPQIAEKIEEVVRMPEPIEFGTAKEGEWLTASKRVTVNFYIDGYRFSDEFMVIPGLSEEAVIGAKTLQGWRLKLDFEKEEIIIDPRVTKLRI